MSTLKTNTIKNTDDVEMYLAKAWVNFDGTGTVAIRAAGNVSSITDNGTGDYTINFTNAMPDANFAIIGSGNYGNEVNWRVPVPRTYSTSNARINTLYADANNNPSPYDGGLINIAIFR